jgi:hypothetical protein
MRFSAREWFDLAAQAELPVEDFLKVAATLEEAIAGEGKQRLISRLEEIAAKGKRPSASVRLPGVAGRAGSALAPPPAPPQGDPRTAPDHSPA